MAHTPGPWKVVDRFYVWTDDDVGCEVAKVCDENLDDDMLGQADADARLIAAAPELLEALIAAKGTIEYLLANSDNGPAENCIEIIADAIAKAEGRADG